jgi:hypothetical protein
MTVNEALRMIAGGLILLSVILAVVWSPWWLLLTAFVGANLLQSALTKWCPMMTFLRRMGLKEG